jgi:hypothetical protein
VPCQKASATAASLALGGTAFAGEDTGNDKRTPISEHRAGSICSFSGLNDDPSEPGSEGKTQTFGGELQRFAQIYPGGVSSLARDGIIKTGHGQECRGYASGG